MVFEMARNNEGVWPVVRRGGVGLRLVGSVLSVSLCVAIALTSLQLYWEYRSELGAIERCLDGAKLLFVGALSGPSGGTDFSAAAVRLGLEAVLQLPDVAAVSLRPEPGVLTQIPPGESLAVGRHRDDAPMVRRFSVNQLGTVTVEASEAALNAADQRVWGRGGIIAACQVVQTTLVTLFTLFIVYWLVIRHVVAIARFVGRFDIREPGATRLALARGDRPSGCEDELDQAVGAFNALLGRLETAYRELHTVNIELAADNHARRLAEQEISHLNAQLEHRVRQRTRELEAANRELAAFAHSVSHDLRAPLRRIDGFTRIVEEDYGGRLDSAGVGILGRVRAAIRDMGEMIDSFLSLSRCTRQELFFESVDISAMTAQVVAVLREKDPGRAVQTVIQPGLTAQGDRRLIKLALENLLDNAWKYTRQTPAPLIAIGMSERSGSNGPQGVETEFFVCDNGAGFDVAYAKRLFSPFQRFHDAEVYEGSGVGLATVQRIIARHGGGIRAEAAVGVGATFYFTLDSGVV